MTDPRLTSATRLTIAVGLALAGGAALAQRCDPALFATDTIELAYAPGPLEHCLAEGRDLSAFDLSLDGAPATPSPRDGCGTSDGPPTFHYDLSGVPGGGADGAIYLYTWEVDGELFGAEALADAPALADFLQRINPSGRWRYDEAGPFIVSDLTAGDYSALSIRWEATSTDYTLPLRVGTAAGGAITLPDPGRDYEVVATARDGSCEERVTLRRLGPAGVDPPPPSTRRYTVGQDEDTGQLCVPTDDVPLATETTVCEPATNGSVRVLGIGCFAYRPVRGFSGEDQACIVTCDDDGRCDTTYLAFTVTPAATPCGTFAVEGPSRLRVASCESTGTLRIRRTDGGGGGGDPTFTADGDAVAATALGDDLFAVTLPVGTTRVTASTGGEPCARAFPVEVVCGSSPPGPCTVPFDETLLGQGVNCLGDTREIFLPATPRELTDFEIVIEGVAYDGPRVERVDPRDGLPGTVIRLSGPRAVLQAVELQRDSACAHAFQLATRCVTPAFDTLLLRVGDPREFCLSSAELFQRLNEPSVASLGDPDLVSVVPADGGCVTAVANASGATDAALVACTRIGICDTTYLHLLATAAGRDDPSPPTAGPVATDDRFVVDVGARLEVDLLANDRPAGSRPTTTLLSAYRYGDGEVSPSGRLTYASSGEVCGVVDTASYALCDERGCDTAVAAVRVRCDTLVVFPGFSPNGDGVNDVFLIEGLDDYPGARLLVFNRWGTLVHEAVDYASDWEGRFDGLDLPDGVYFYLLELPRRSSPVTGYVALYR